MIALSSIVTYLCLLASAFSTKILHIFLFQSVFMGLAQGLGYPLYISMPSQWFLKKRGFATGLALSGSGIGAGIGSLIVRALYVSLFACLRKARSTRSQAVGRGIQEDDAHLQQHACRCLDHGVVPTQGAYAPWSIDREEEVAPGTHHRRVLQHCFVRFYWHLRLSGTSVRALPFYSP